jgi:DNA invertase Pin-like site-specific DNA recombinase
MNVGYARTSTTDQAAVLAAQKRELKAAGARTGLHHDRRELEVSDTFGIEQAMILRFKPPWNLPASKQKAYL